MSWMLANMRNERTIPIVARVPRSDVMVVIVTVSLYPLALDTVLVVLGILLCRVLAISMVAFVGYIGA